MSEYQFYDFLAVDRPLSAEDRADLRRISSRARITASGFTNSYSWGDLKANPRAMMARWFDVHVYLSNWNTRSLMLRLPRALVDLPLLGRCIAGSEDVTLSDAGEALILEVTRRELDDEGWIEDDPPHLAALAPLRAEFLGGDPRLGMLLWLLGVDDEAVADDAPEPVAGLGPLLPSTEFFAAMFRLDPDLVAAAAERPAQPGPALSAAALTARIEALPQAERTGFLLRAAEGDPHVGAALRRRLHGPADAPAPRNAGELRARAAALGEERRRVAAEREAAARRVRLDALAARGEAAWAEVDAAIARRNAAGYQQALAVLAALRELAADRGTLAAFAARLAALRARTTRLSSLRAGLDAFAAGGE